MERIFSKEKLHEVRMDRFVRTRINGGMTISEPADGHRFGTDALLLAAFACGHLPKGVCADFGTGSGVLPLLLHAAGCNRSFDAYEIQASSAEIAERNAEENGLYGKIRVIRGDLREYKTLFPRGSYASVVCNPPYFPAGSGRLNPDEGKRTARHADTLSVAQFADAAGWALQTGGKFFCVYPASGLAALFDRLKFASVEPKRLRLVAPSVSEKPTLALVEAKKDAAEGLIAEPLFRIYEDLPHQVESAEMKETYLLFEKENKQEKQI